VSLILKTYSGFFKKRSEELFGYEPGSWLVHWLVGRVFAPNWHGEGVWVKMQSLVV